MKHLGESWMSQLVLELLDHLSHMLNFIAEHTLTLVTIAFLLAVCVIIHICHP